MKYLINHFLSHSNKWFPLIYWNLHVLCNNFNNIIYPNVFKKGVYISESLFTYSLLQFKRKKVEHGFVVFSIQVSSFTYKNLDRQTDKKIDMFCC